MIATASYFALGIMISVATGAGSIWLGKMIEKRKAYRLKCDLAIEDLSLAVTTLNTAVAGLAELLEKRLPSKPGS